MDASTSILRRGRTEKAEAFPPVIYPPPLASQRCTRQLVKSLEYQVENKTKTVPFAWQDGVHLLDNSTLELVEGKSTKVIDTRCAHEFSRRRTHTSSSDYSAASLIFS